MPTSSAGHRVIGIRYTLKHLKSAGLVEQDRLYPDQAVKDVQSEVLAAAERWYEIGANCGALEVLEAILDGKIEVQTTKKGKLVLVTKLSSVVWEKRLNVTVGNRKKSVAERTYELTVQELGFKD